MLCSYNGYTMTQAWTTTVSDTEDEIHFRLEKSHREWTFHTPDTALNTASCRTQIYSLLHRILQDPDTYAPSVLTLLRYIYSIDLCRTETYTPIALARLKNSISPYRTQIHTLHRFLQSNAHDNIGTSPSFHHQDHRDISEGKLNLPDSPKMQAETHITNGYLMTIQLI